MKAETKARLGELLADETSLTREQRQPTADPTDPENTLRVTLALLQSKEFAQAQTLLRWALDFDPEDTRLLRRMCDITLLLGDQEEARRWGEKAIAVDPQDPHNHDNLAKLFIWVGDFAAAEAAETRAVDLAPHDAAMTARLLDIQKWLGKIRE